jgi:dolichol-phosphate mannosyltransferase
MSALELAVIIPTFNEVGNVRALIQLIDQALPGVTWEAIFVDDASTDGTPEAVRALGLQDTRVRLIRRFGRRGLSSACVEGLLSSHAPFMAVIDADLQHDERLLPQMLAELRSASCDLVVGSRYVDGGGVADWDAKRVGISRLATRLSQKMLGTTVQDPMSGFFMLRREALLAAVPQLSNMGFKILLDLLMSHPTPLRVKELPYTFRTRQSGESKLDHRVAWDFLMMLADKTIGRFVPVRFLSFGLIGGFGVLVHLLVLRILLIAAELPFSLAQSGAVLVAMASNFTLNNLLTYQDQRLSGSRFAWGMLKFMLLCGLGAVANVGVSAYIYDGGGQWLLSALAGILVGTVWNYVATSRYVWSWKS